MTIVFMALSCSLSWPGALLAHLSDKAVVQAHRGYCVFGAFPEVMCVVATLPSSTHAMCAPLRIGPVASWCSRSFHEGSLALRMTCTASFS